MTNSVPAAPAGRESPANRGAGEPDVRSHVERSKQHLLGYMRGRVADLDEKLLGKAVEFSILAHRDQYRRSGLPYVEHPFAVAKLLADMHMDNATVAAGLLHDVVEDTSTTVDVLAEEFGPEVAFLVDAVTKISAVQAKTRLDRQALTFRKMLLSMSKDLRVLLIKFADRLHNMRTLGYMQEEKKKAIARETLDVYAPLSHRFGLARMRWELEDLAFKHLNPDAYRQLVDKVMQKRESREALVRSMVEPVGRALEERGIGGQVSGRPKHLYSIYKKMESRNCSFEAVYDLLAMRIIVESVSDCYAALGIVHGLWTPLQTRFKDYIANPKSNRYQSLHTTVIGPGGSPVEFQIRTREMDNTAEIGIAAHWGYKEGREVGQVEREKKWLANVLEWQEDVKDSSEFMEFFRVNLKSDEIFVFTPDGDLIQLPKGATALDFAYAVHTEVGNRCIGAKVEGKVVALDKALNTGSTVEILKSDVQHPSEDWLSIVITPKARYCIRKWLKAEGWSKSVGLGRELLLREFRNAGVPPEVLEDLEPFARAFEVRSWEELHMRVGNGEISLGELSQLLGGLNPSVNKGVLHRVRRARTRERGNAVQVSGHGDMLVSFATCCLPVPGDGILGYVSRGAGIEVHRDACPRGAALSREKDRIVPVRWKVDTGHLFSAFVEISGRDRPGLLKDLAVAMNQHGIQLERGSLVTHRGQVRDRLLVRVANASALERFLKSVRKLPEVRGAHRKLPGSRLRPAV